MAESTYANPTEGARHAPLLSVRDLSVSFATDAGMVETVRGVDLDLYPGEVLGIVGESGSGKSVTCQALLGLLPDTAHVSGQLNVAGRRIDPMDRAGMAGLRGRLASMIFQDPMSALDPLMTVRGHLIQRLKRHDWQGDAETRALELLRLVGIPHPARVADAWAHQLSGGLCQRAAIALALAGQPQLLIADEPTTALDVSVQAQVLDLIEELRATEELSVILISHDFGVVAQSADRIAVMYAGELVETGPVREVLDAPGHPYAAGLLAARPDIDRPPATLRPIAGSGPRSGARPAGCAFAPRCAIAAPGCASPVPLRETTQGRRVRCVTPGQAVSPDPIRLPPVATRPAAAAPLLALRDGRVVFRRGATPLTALDGISLDVAAGESLAIVGESGCGKSTLAKLITGLLAASGEVTGEVLLDGARIDGLRGRAMVPIRRRMQYVFQDPLGALDPRMGVLEQVREPLSIHRIGPPAARGSRAEAALRSVGIEGNLFPRVPAELSGGQRQRVVLARALVLDPEILIADEPVSALDVSIQAEILRLLAERRRALGLTMVFISHDLAVVRQVAERIAVLYLGRIVESGPIETIFTDPAHPYTRALLDAAPRLIPRPDPLRLRGEPPAPGARPSGCAFATRCPAAREVCHAEDPALRAGGGRAVACHFPHALENAA